jgi:RNA polymerase sigma-70 factor (family 1)
LREKIYQEHEAFIAFLSGDERGFDYFFNRYYSPLVLYAAKITGNYEVARDITSEAFIKIWNTRESFAEYPKIRFTLYRIVYNASTDYLRKQNAGQRAISNLTAFTDPVENSFLESLIETETYNNLYVMLSSLPDRCRQVFQMFYFQDKAIKEIAEELGISVNTVKSQKQRAIQLLKERHSQ